MPTWDSITDRIGNAWTGLIRGAGDAAILAYEMVSLPVAAAVGADEWFESMAGEGTRTGGSADGVLDLSVWQAMAEQAPNHGLSSISNLFGAEGFGGSLIGGLPEQVRAPLREPVRQVGEGIEFVGREVIREPIAALMMAGSLAQAGDGFSNLDDQFRRFTDIDTWRRARWLTDNINPDFISPGQAVMLAIGTNDITDPDEIRRVMGTDWWHFTTGALDATVQIFGDPTFLAGKWTKAGASGLLARDARVASRAYGTLENLARREGLVGRVVANMSEGSATRRGGLLNMTGRWGHSPTAVARDNQRLITLARVRREGYLNGGWGGRSDGPISDTMLDELAGMNPRQIRDRLRGTDPRTLNVHLGAIGQIEIEVASRLQAEMAEKTAGRLGELDDELAGLADSRSARQAEAATAEADVRRRLDDLVANPATTADELEAAHAELDGLRRDSERALRQLDVDEEKVRSAQAMAEARGMLDPADADPFLAEMRDGLSGVTDEAVTVRNRVDVFEQMAIHKDLGVAQIDGVVGVTRAARDEAARQHRRATRIATRRVRPAQAGQVNAINDVSAAGQTIDRTIGEVLVPLAAAATRDWIGYMETVGREARRPSNLREQVGRIGAEFDDAIEQIRQQAETVRATTRTTSFIAGADAGQTVAILDDAVAELAEQRRELAKTVAQARRYIEGADEGKAEAGRAVLAASLNTRARMDETVGLLRDTRDEATAAARKVGAGERRRMTMADTDETRAIEAGPAMGAALAATRRGLGDGPVMLGREVTDLPAAINVLEDQIGEMTAFIESAPAIRRAARAGQVARQLDPSLGATLDPLVEGLDSLVDGVKARRSRLEFLRDEARRVALEPERLTTKVWEVIRQELDEVRDAERQARDRYSATAEAATLLTATTGSELVRMKDMVAYLVEKRAILRQESVDLRKSAAQDRRRLFELERKGDHLHSRIQAVQEAYDSFSDEKVRRMAGQVADLLFPRESPHRLEQALLISRASGAHRREVMAFMLGESDAIRSLHGKRQRLFEQAAQVKSRVRLVGETARRQAIMHEAERIGPLSAFQGPNDPATRRWIADQLGEEYALRMESPHIARMDIERLDELNALIDSMEQIRVDLGQVQVVRGPVADALSRWEAMNGLDTIDQVDSAIRFAEREIGFLKALEWSQNSIAGLPAIRLKEAARQGTLAGRAGMSGPKKAGRQVGQATEVFHAFGSRRHRVIYNAAKVANEWAYPDNPGVARRVATMPARGALTFAELATARRPPARIRLEDPHASRHVTAMLRAAGMPDDAISEGVARFTTTGALERAGVFNELRDKAFKQVFDDVGLTDPALQQTLLNTVYDAEQVVSRHQRAFGVNQAFFDPDGNVLVHIDETAQLSSQAPIYAHTLDFHLLAQRARVFQKRITKGAEPGSALWDRRMKGAASMGLDSIQRVWKYATLLRPAWATRVVMGDEVFRRGMVSAHFVTEVAKAIAVSPAIIGVVLARLADELPAHIPVAGFRKVTAGEALQMVGGGVAGGLMAGPVGLVAGAAATRGAIGAGRRLRGIDGPLIDTDTFELAGLTIPSALDNTEEGRRYMDAVSAADMVTEFTTERDRVRVGSAATETVPTHPDIQAFIDRSNLPSAPPVHPNPSGTRATATVRAVEAKAHLNEWSQLLNKQFGNDDGIRQLIKFHLDDPSKAPGRFNRWISRTAEGKQYLKSVGLTDRRDVAEFAAERMERLTNFVTDYVGWEDTDDVLRAILDGTVTPGMLDEMFPDLGDRPIIHQQMVVDGLLNTWGKMAGRLVETLMDAFAVIPTDYLVRMPMFRNLYSQEMARRLAVRGWTPGTKVAKADLDIEVAGARDFALSMTRHHAFDAADSTQLQHLLRYLIPFAPAQQEVVQRWVGFAVTDPDRVALMYAAWDAMSDQAEERIAGDPDSGKVFRVSLPSVLDPRTFIAAMGGEGFETTGDWVVPADAFSMNPVTGGVQSVTNLGVGPVVGVPVARYLRNNPRLSEHGFVEMFFPFGVPTDSIEAVIPGWQKQFLPKLLDPERYARTYNNILQTRFVWAQMGDPRQPAVDWNDPNAVADFIEDVKDEATKYHFTTGILNSAMPFTLQFDSMFAAHKNEWNRIRTRVLQEGGDYSTAEAEFYDLYGAEMMALTESFMDSNRGIPPTIGGYEMYERYQPFLDANKRIASAFLAQDPTLDVPDVEYSAATRDYLQRQIDRTTGEPFYELSTPQEWIADVETASGWIAFNRMAQLVDAEVESRGLPNINVSDASELKRIRDERIVAIAEQYPAWGREYLQQDQAAQIETRQQLRNWVEAADEFGMDGRPDVQAIAEYLTFRDSIVSVLRERDAEGGPSTLGAQANRDLLEVAEQMLLDARNQSTHFAAVYNRWFARDLERIAADDEVFGEDRSVMEVNKGLGVGN